MRNPTLYIIALIAISGFIAYWGDILGRRMGKKRLTIGKLRPKHTAIFVTTITGMLISALALGALLTLDKEFKKIITHGRQILDQNTKYRSDNRELAERNVSLAKLSGLLEAEIAKLEAEVVAAREAVGKATKTRDAALRSVTRLESEIALRKRELSGLRKRTEVAEKELIARTLRLEAVQNDLDRARANLVKAQSQLAAAGERLLDTTAKLTEADNKLAEQEKALEEQRKQLEEQLATLVRVGKEKLEFEKQTSELRTSELILRQGDELVRGTISPRQPLFGIRGDVFSLLESASLKAIKLGAANGDNDRAVAVVFRQPVSGQYGVAISDERTCVEMAVRTIASGFQDALVQVVCARNSLVGEQTPVELRLYLNNLVYRKGARIAGEALNGRASEGRILLGLIDFLQKNVSEAALRAGIIPISNPDPRTAYGQSRRDQVDALMAVVDTIKEKNAKVVVEAFADEDVYAAGPLDMFNMRFIVTSSQ